MKIEITRVVYQHHIARLQEKAANQIDGLRARFGQHNLLGRHFQARAVQASGNQAAQGWQAQRCAVFAQTGRIVARQCAQGAAHAVFKQPLRRQPTTTWTQQLFFCVQSLTRNPQRVNCPLLRAACLHQGQRRGSTEHIIARACFCQNQALRHQALIRFCHRRYRHLQMFGLRPHRRQARPRHPCTRVDLCAHMRHDLRNAACKLVCCHSFSNCIAKTP